MRFRRLVLPLLAALALTAAMISSPAPSSAAETRNVTFRSGEKGDTGQFYVVGRAENWVREYVQLQKRDCRAARCEWHQFRATISGSKGGFRFDFGGRIGNCFRIFIRASPGYKWVLKPVGCIVRG
jgi:hypothetical protein